MARRCVAERRFFGSAVAASVAPASRAPSAVRRRGVAGAARNCCFDEGARAALLGQANLGLIPKLLYPLAGPEGFDADDATGGGRAMDATLLAKASLPPPGSAREPEKAVRRELVGALLMLAQERAGRAALRRAGTYRVVQQAHLVEARCCCRLPFRFACFAFADDYKVHAPRRKGAPHPLKHVDTPNDTCVYEATHTRTHTRTHARTRTQSDRTTLLHIISSLRT